MRHALLFAPVLTLILAAAASCGGSSSETPPPAEPDPATLVSGPAGENAKPPLITPDRERREGFRRRDGGPSSPP